MTTPITPTAPAGPTAPPGTAVEIARLLSAGTIDTTQAGRLARAGNIKMLDIARAHSGQLAGPVPPMPARTDPIVAGPETEISASQAATMIERHKAELASGTISQEQANKIFDQLGATPEQRGPDTRTDEQKLVDQHFPAAKPEDYLIRWNAPGDTTPLSAEAKQLDTSARTWLSGAGMPVNVGNSLVNQITKVLQTTRGLTESQLEQRGYDEFDKLKQAHGDKLDERLRQAGLMVEDLEKTQPGLKHLLKSKGIGDDALIANLLIGHAPIYHARRKGAMTMRTFVLSLVLVLGLASPALAAITEVASQRADATLCTNADTCSLAFPNNVTAGNLLVVGGGVNDNDTGPAAYTITDTVGTSYTVLQCTTIDSGADSESTPFIAYGIAAGSGANTVTVDPALDASAWFIDFSIDEFTGVHATPLDVDGGSSTGTSTTPSDDILTVTANDLVVGVMGIGSLSNTMTPGTGYTQIGESQSGNAGFNFEFQIVTTATTYTVAWTADNEPWTACTAAFKEAVAAAILQQSGGFLPLILGF